MTEDTSLLYNLMQIQQIKVEDLIPYINNSRTHSDEQVAQIAASIKEFGWTNPILVDGNICVKSCKKAP